MKDLFPAWKTNFNDMQLDEIGDEFEDIEHKMFGKDGFEDAEKQIGDIESKLGFPDLGAVHTAETAKTLEDLFGRDDRLIRPIACLSATPHIPRRNHCRYLQR